MAKPGTYTAYQQLRPLQSDLASDVIAQDELALRRRQEQRIEDQIAQQRLDKEQAKKDKLREQMLGQIPKNFDTGSSSLNGFNAKLIQQGVNRLGEIYQKLGSGNLNDDEKIQLQLEAQNIENLPNNIKLATDKFSGVIQDYQKGKAEGRYFPNPDFEKLVLSGFDNYVGTLDNGLPTVGFIDRNEDGIVDVKDVQPFETLSQGISSFDFQKQYDLDKMAVETAKTLGSSDITKDIGYRSVQTKQANIDQLDKIANNLFINPDGSPTPVAMSQIRKMGLETDPDALNKAKQYYKDRVLADTDYTRKEDFDYAARNNDAQEARLSSKEAPDSKVTWGVVETPPAYTDAGQSSAQGYKTIAVQGKTSVPSLQFYEGDKKVRLTNPSIQSYTVRKNKDGQRYIVAEVVYQDVKGSRIKKEGSNDSLDTNTETLGERKLAKVIPLTEKDAKIFALQMGFKNVNEMKDAARVTEQEPATPKPSASSYGL